MDKGFVLTILEIGDTITVGTAGQRYTYRMLLGPNHACADPKPLKVRDQVEVVNLHFHKDGVLVKGPSGCLFFLYDLVAES